MDPAEIRRRLEAEREALAGELEAMKAAPMDPMASVSFGKRVGEGTSQAVERIALVSAARSLDAKLRDVERALEKLHEGSYGTCDACGRPIGAERLEAIPSATRCIRCARSSPATRSSGPGSAGSARRP